MKRVVFLVVCSTILLSISTVAYAAGPYVSGNIALTIPSDSDVSESGLSAVVESHDGIGFGIALGYDAEFIRYEAEFISQNNDLENISATGYGTALLGGDITSTGFLLNFYYDIESDGSFIPYLTAGFGYANVEVSPISVPGYGTVTASSYDDNVFAYQFGAGIGIPLGVGNPFYENTMIDIEYRYFATKDPDFEGTGFEYSSHNIYAGIRYSF